MRRICAWCGAALDPRSATADGPISHGICASCLAGLREERSHSFAELLERLDAPVLLVGPDAVQ